MKRLNLTSLNVLFSVTMLLVMGIVVLMLLWRVESEINQFDDFQKQMMQKQAQVSASEVAELVASIRNRMRAISLDNFFLKDFEKFKSLESLQIGLQQRLQNYFPEMFTFTIADQHGEPLASDDLMLVGDMCRADLQHTAGLLDEVDSNPVYEPWIHPQPDGYHFDMMLATHAFDQRLVFFISFKTDLLTRALNQKAFTKHDIFLLRVDKPGLIEVSQQGSRDQLKRDFYLTDAEQAAIGANVPVENTRWEVAVVPNPALRAAFVEKCRDDAWAVFLVFSLFWLLLFIFGQYEESKKGRLLAHLRHQSLHDTLTGLANRRFLYRAFQESLAKKRLDGEFSGVFYLDLNGFKPVNDEHGHEVGDALLKLVAKRLLACSRQEDLVARVGGDEFVVLLNCLGKDQNKARRYLEETESRLYKHLMLEYTIDGKCHRVSASIGSALLVSDDCTLDTLLKEADKKMYLVKTKLSAGCE